MRALSLWQPWASAIALGLKAIETRHWSTGVRGLIAIHAAKRWTPDEREDAAMFAERFDERLRNPPLGFIIATAEIVACKRTEDLIGKISATEEAFGNYGPKRFGFILDDVRPLAVAVPWRGAQGFFEVDADTVFAAQPSLPGSSVTPPQPVQGLLL
ncbi:ASCH domain-containing protein [Sphingomonas sp. MS122]|uniref:ASCH domain-containing protein n=1 Tax=Sphingomonas sp. MS122 TaxID=3412683 RepID=UPI003C2CD883